MHNTTLLFIEIRKDKNMPNPKRKHSKSRKWMRRAHLSLSSPNFSICPRCKTEKLPHRICTNCGYYKGSAVVKL
jgi:large subunit ribosomal protein L32